VSADTFHEDEILGKAYDRRLMKRLVHYLRPYRRRVIASVFLLFAIAALELVGPVVVQKAIDGPIADGVLSELWKYVAIFVGSLAVAFVLRYIQTLIMNRVGQEVMAHLRVEIFAHLQRMHLGFYDKNPVGRLLTRVTSDVAALNELFTSGVVAIFGDIFTLIGIVAVLLYYSWKLALVTFIVLPFLMYATWLFKIRARESYRAVRKQTARLSAYLQEQITGMAVVQLFAQEPKAQRRFDNINSDLRQAHFNSILYYALFFPGVEFLGAVSIGLIIWYGGGQIVAGFLTAGALVAYLQLAERFYRPIRDLAEKYNIFQAAMAASERIFDLLDTAPVIAAPAMPQRPEIVRGEIVLKDLDFAYNKEDWVLKNISLHVKAGEKLAIVGHTGAGKTSIINLLCRFYDYQQGSIRFDGVELKDWDPEELREHIGLVLQDVFLFSGDIQSNIRLGRKDIGDERVRWAAEQVNAARFIERKASGYSHEVTERGSTYSVGEKQLLAFARALAFDPKVLILDEATSSVDTETEILIQSALKRLLEGRTSIVIAHRLSTIRDMDRIVVLHKGTIREIGTHDELMALQGIYYRLYQLQYKDQETALAG
jgi:ATP-binding cassette subfamily B multidrug efflux pump